MSDILNHSLCLSTCLATFGNMIIPGDQDFEKVCQVLSDRSMDHIFSWLYCCDGNCGTQFGSGAELDPNINNVIKRCKGFGISDLFDPGPPQVSQCQTMLASTVISTTLAFSSTITSGQIFTSTSVSSVSFDGQRTATPTLAINSSSHSQKTAFPSSLTMASSTSNSIFADPSTSSTRTNTPFIPKPSTSSNSSPSITVLPSKPTKSPTNWQKLSPSAKLGSILGLTLLLFLLSVFAIIFIVRHKRRAVLLAAHLADTDSQRQSEDEAQSTHSSSTPNASVRPRKLCEVVVVETEGKNSVDSVGIRWPERVMLTGDAKEMWEWSVGYVKEFRERSSLDRQRMRRGEKFFE